MPAENEQAKTTKANARTKKFTSKQGNEYTFQKVLPSLWLDKMDEVNETGAPKRSILYPVVLENVVVVPNGLRVDDFEKDGRGGFGELEEVVKAALTFQQGKQ